ncbi:uncharacterized protein LOC129584217 [Paramacrobiotus metropolitanus]|uniref:uncharacterized protein LOC129584217 n=1 Tax=Paramacrobiotus metropolitanus TaxID=2943436 RepID=UPI002445776A|nr:uncharacterized protein LOC129584217 [Paramacrobiotus metropolitanus]
MSSIIVLWLLMRFSSVLVNGDQSASSSMTFPSDDANMIPAALDAAPPGNATDITQSGSNGTAPVLTRKGMSFYVVCRLGPCMHQQLPSDPTPSPITVKPPSAPVDRPIAAPVAKPFPAPAAKPIPAPVAKPPHRAFPHRMKQGNP